MEERKRRDTLHLNQDYTPFTPINYVRTHERLYKVSATSVNISARLFRGVSSLSVISKNKSAEKDLHD